MTFSKDTKGFGRTIMNNLVYVINGPNLNLLGERQPHIYGSETLADVEADCRNTANELGLTIRFLQTNAEFQVIEWIQEARGTAAGIVINAAAYTHTSVAILDALNMCECPVIEVHISNVYKREEFRHRSFISLRADAVIGGCGTQGYTLALHRLAKLLADGPAASNNPETLSTRSEARPADRPSSRAWREPTRR